MHFQAVEFCNANTAHVVHHNLGIAAINPAKNAKEERIVTRIGKRISAHKALASSVKWHLRPSPASIELDLVLICYRAGKLESDGAPMTCHELEEG